MANHLASEKSPYLQQHAQDPIDWYPWSEEAFALSRSRNAPIFLSIGYATCHFCHVMRRESFSDKEIARSMNELFVNIKVDREDLPEVDRLYMELAQGLMASPGGWPLNLVLTPELKPFFATTYLPAQAEHGLMGMQEFVTQIDSLWNSPERELLIEQADQLVDIFSSLEQDEEDELPERSLVDETVEILLDLADPVFGGLKTEPKFPLAYHLNFLLERAQEKEDPRPLFYVELTLKMLKFGGIFDRLGGGFSRYCVDLAWHIPHFEKMLYDNALISSAYLAAWQWTKKEVYARVVRKTLDYLLCDMADKEGSFYSAEDADSEGVEGLFYTWTEEEIREVLEPADAELFCQFYDVTKEGNCEGRSILHQLIDQEAFAEENGLEEADLEEILEEAGATLLKERNKRTRPFKDQKILTSWNGLVIDALARASKALKEPRYMEKALSAARFIKENLMCGARLFHRYYENEARFEANLDDYAFLIRALLTLFESDQGTEFLDCALELTECVEDQFKAPKGAFYSSREEESLFRRRMSFYDGAEPSGNGVHAENLLRLYQITQKRHYLYQAEDIFKAAAFVMDEMPTSALYLMRVLNRYYDKRAVLVVVVLDKEESLKGLIEKAYYTQFAPHAAIVWKREGDLLLTKHLPFLEDKILLNGKTTLYVCRQDHCLAPVSQEEEVMQQLRNL